MTNELNINPEVILLDTLNNALTYVKEDFLSGTEADTYLFKSLQGIQLGTYDFYEQAKQLIINSGNLPRVLRVDYKMDMQTKPVPVVVISNTTESPAADGQWLSAGQGYIVAEDIAAPGAMPVVFTRRKNAATSLVILSDDPGEIVMLYHLISSLLLSFQAHLNLKGIEHLTFGCAVSEYYSEQIPTLHNKALILNYDYNFSAVAIPQTFM